MELSYSSAKGRYVQQKMNEGYSNSKARQIWKRSDERKQYPSEFEHIMNKAGGDTREVTDNIDRDYNSPWQDYAGTSDDL